MPVMPNLSRFLFRYLECRERGMQPAADSAICGIHTAEFRHRYIEKKDADIRQQDVQFIQNNPPSNLMTAN